MRLSTLLAWSPVLLAGNLQGQVRKEWDPSFDYTNLRPSDDELWALLANVQVTLEGAIDVAKSTEGKVWVQSAELVQDEALHWDLQLFVDAGADKAKRVHLEVSAAEPKVLNRVELMALAPGDMETWRNLGASEVPLEQAIEIVKEAAKGEKEKEVLLQTRIHSAGFGGEGKNPHWDLELFGLDEKGPQVQVRRYHFRTSAKAPRIQRRFLRDRFPGEPLRRGKPELLPSGLWIYDFTPGDGQVLSPDSKITVNYRLFLLDDTKLHDTWETRLTETFVLGEAPLKGMSEGMQGMRVGGRRKIAMPYALAFGEQGNELAPPKAMVVCDVEVLSTESP